MMKLNKYLEAKLTYFKIPFPPNILSLVNSEWSLRLI